jgi:small-conductance mechanosensitive channel
MNSIANWLNQLSPDDGLYWLMAVIFLIVIIIGGNLLKRFGYRFFNSERSKTVWSKIMNWLILFIVTVFLFSYLSTSSWMYETLFVLGETNITPILILIVVFSLIIGFRFSNLLRETILTGVYARYNIERSMQATINTLLHYFIVLVVLLFALNSLGFNLTSLTVFAGVLGVGVGFGLRNIMNNFISGLIILFDRPIKVDDRVVVDGTIIDIEKIKIRNTIGHTRANERIVIPNSYFLEEKFINRSYSDKRLRITVGLSVPYGSDLRLAKKLMEDAVIELSETTWQRTMREPQPKVFVEEFADYDISMKVWFWIDDQSDESEFIIPSDVRYLIYDKFNENNVDFSSPRQDVLLLDEEE